jgi:hypothetical protein
VSATGGDGIAIAAAAAGTLTRGGSAGGATDAAMEVGVACVFAGATAAFVGVACAGTVFAVGAGAGFTAGEDCCATFGELQPGGGTICTML